MSRSQRVLVSGAVLFLLVACRHPFQPTQAEVCTYDKAVRVGESHAMSGISQFGNVSYVCAIDVREEVDRGYDEGYQQGMALRLENERARVCGYDAGYKDGANDGQRGVAMQGQVPDVCTAATIAETERGYREGYTFGMENKPAQVNVTMDHSGHGILKPAARPEEECIEAYGQKECGYGCIEAYGQLRCATEPNHRCIEAYGQIACGLNCTESFGELSCDEEE